MSRTLSEELVKVPALAGSEADTSDTQPTDQEARP